jgi:hypothetical protein
MLVVNQDASLLESLSADARLALALTGGTLAIVPAGALAYGTTHRAAALAVGGFGIAYVALAVASMLKAMQAHR